MQNNNEDEKEYYERNILDHIEEDIHPDTMDTDADLY